MSLTQPEPSKPGTERPGASSRSSVFLSRPPVRWLISITFGFLAAAVIVNLALPIIVDIDTPQWFMKTFPILGGPILWLAFGLLTNYVLKRQSNDSQ